MSALPPNTRASFAHDIQGVVRTLDAVTRDRVIARAGAIWQEVERTPAVVWLDESTYDAFIEAVRGALGDAAFVTLNRSNSRRLVKNPSIQTAVEAFVRLFGVTPHTGLKFSPRARAALARNAGDLAYVRVGEGHGQLVLTGFPHASKWSFTTTVLTLQGTWLGVTDVFEGKDGTCEVIDVDERAGSCTFDVRWR